MSCQHVRIPNWLPIVPPRLLQLGFFRLVFNKCGVVYALLLSGLCAVNVGRESIGSAGPMPLRATLPTLKLDSSFFLILRHTRIPHNHSQHVENSCCFAFVIFFVNLFCRELFLHLPSSVSTSSRNLCHPWAGLCSSTVAKSSSLFEESRSCPEG
jgi:hypothetical protein